MDVKPGWTTSEFYITLATMFMPLLTLLLHNDYSGYVQVVATVAAGISTVVYTVMRSMHKTKVSVAALASPVGLESKGAHSA